MLKLDLRKRSTFETINNNFSNAEKALNGLGYEKVQIEQIYYKGEYKQPSLVFYKDGKYYLYEGMDNNKTFIFVIYLRELVEVD